MTGATCGAKNWSIPLRLFEPASKEPPPIRSPPSQLFSANLMIEAVLISWWLT
jgi:hypothetical protein